MPSTDIDDADAKELRELGYTQLLRRGLGAYTSFALAFSMISITNAIFFLFAGTFTTIGGVGIWLWLVVTGGVLLITLVYAHLSARIPITGYAYHWNSRLVSAHYGWFSGWTALVSFFAGTASIGVSLATVFSPVVWSHPSKGNIVLFAAIAIGVAVVINILSVRLAGWVNNAGVSLEIFGTLGAALILLVGLAFFRDARGLGVLFQVGPVNRGDVSLAAIGLAALLPVYTLIGWEGSADLAEETKDPRRTTPKAMLRAVVISAIAAFAVIIAFAAAIPGRIASTINAAENPMLHIFGTQLGPVLGATLKVVVFIAIFSCLLANVTVATRMCYALARDNMLPGARIWSYVDPRTRTPVFAILLVGVVALGVNLLSAGIASRVVSIVTVSYYGTYALTVIAALWALQRERMPQAPQGYFSLGKWLRPVAVAGLAWAIVVIVDFTATNHVAALYTLGAEVVGAMWYVGYLRRALRRGTVGPATGGAAGKLTDARLGVVGEAADQGHQASTSMSSRERSP